jgi:hypothetical protein
MMNKLAPKVLKLSLKTITCFSLVFLLLFSSLEPAYAQTTILATAANQEEHTPYVLRSLKSGGAFFSTCIVGFGISSMFFPPASVSVPLICAGIASHGVWLPWLMTDEEYNTYSTVLDGVSGVTAVTSMAKDAILSQPQPQMQKAY